MYELVLPVKTILPLILSNINDDTISFPTPPKYVQYVKLSVTNEDRIRNITREGQERSRLDRFPYSHVLSKMAKKISVSELPLVA